MPRFTLPKNQSQHHAAVLQHLVRVLGPTTKADLTAAFEGFERAQMSKGELRVYFDLATLILGKPERSPKRLTSAPKSFATLLRHHGSIRFEKNGYPSGLHVRWERLDRDEGWLEGTALEKSTEPILIAARDDADLLIFDPSRKRGREPALVFLSHEGGRGTVQKATIAELIAQRLARLIRVPTANRIKKPTSFKLPNLDGGGLELESKPLKALKSLRPLLERYTLEQRETVTGLRSQGGALTTTDGIELLPNLEYLRLDEQRLRDLKGVDSLKSLRSLDVSQNLLTELPTNATLQKLLMLRNKLTSMAGISRLTQLTKLDLRDNPIERIEGLEELKSLADVMLCERDAKVITAESLRRLSRIERDSTWAKALTIDGALEGPLAADAEVAQFRKVLSDAHRRGAKALAPILAKALKRSDEDLRFAAQRSHDGTPLVEEIPVWGDFLLRAMKRMPQLENEHQAFAENVIGNLANPFNWGWSKERSLRALVFKKYMPKHITSQRLAAKLASLWALDRDLPKTLEAAAFAISLGTPRAFFEHEYNFKRLLKKPEFKAVMAKAKEWAPRTQ